jgi:hypothetical protein
MRRMMNLGLLGLLLAVGMVSITPKTANALQRVQLSVFLVNIVETGGRKTGQMPITVYLDLKDRDEAVYVCGIAPRIRDSLLQHLNKETFYLDSKNVFDVKKLRLDLWPIAYKAIPNVKLQNILVVQGEGKVSSSEARLFSRRGCRMVQDGES